MVCTCVNDFLGREIPTDIINIISGYVHIRNCDLYDAVLDELKDPCLTPDGYIVPNSKEFYDARMEKYGSQYIEWRFMADSFGNTGSHMGYHRTEAVDLDPEIVLSIYNSGQNLMIKISGQSIKMDKSCWGSDTYSTPFSKTRQNGIKRKMPELGLLNYAGRKDAFRLLCDNADSEIWKWFHGGH